VYKRILVPLDGSKLSEMALSHAGVLAKGLGAEVVLLGVVEFLDHDLGDIPIEYAASSEVLEERRHYLEHTASSLRRAGVSVTTFSISGKVADTIIDFADKNNIDLIVMSAHGHSAAFRWLMGSVADKVMHGAHVPVLLIREHKKPKVQINPDPNLGFH
jgi:nucleotide-binding universal stress UspA family protein